jgi:hypothetical protein
MRYAKLGVCLVALAGTIGTCALTPSTAAQTTVGTTFTYQGRLDDNGQPANGTYDFQFQLAPAATGSFSGGSQNVDDVSVVNGLFTCKINFGAAFIGDARFLEVRVRPGVAIGLYTPLAPRQELTPAPYALGLSLPFNERQTNAASLFTLDQNGAGNTMTLTGTDGDCLSITTDGAGDGINVHTSGPSANAIGAYTTAAGAHSVYAQTTGGGVPIYAYNLGTSGYTGFFRNESITNPANCVEIQDNGTGVGIHASARANRAAWFENTNATNPNVVLVAENSSGGTGAAFWAKTNGSGMAGAFDINSQSNTQPALEATTVGTGPAGKFNGRVDVNGKLNAQVGGVLNRATPVAWGRVYPAYPYTLLASSGNVTILADDRIKVNGETNSGNWVIIATIEYGANVSSDHHWEVRPSYPAADGTFALNGNCSGCPEFVNDAITYSFVVYQGN